MQAPEVERLAAQLASLDQARREHLLAALHPVAGPDRILALIQEICAAKRGCPRCACKRCHRHGHANDVQRYRCCQCGRTFNDLTGTPLARLRLRGKWLAYLEALLESRPVRKAAGRLGVHRNTAFRWRHRFLHRVKDDRPAQLERHLLPTFDRQALLVTDSNVAYRSFSRKHALAHQAVNLRAGERTRASAVGAIHVRNVNAYHRRFRQWLMRFNGVASRYLPNYLGWHWALDGGRVNSVERLLRIAIGVVHR